MSWLGAIRPTSANDAFDPALWATYLYNNSNNLFYGCIKARRCRPCKLRAAGRRALRLRQRGGELHGALKSGGARHRRGPRVVRGGRTLRRGRLYDARRFAGSLCCTIPSGRAWASGVGPWARSGDLLSGRCSRAGRLRVCACRGLRPWSYCARSGTRDIRLQLGGSLGPRACGVQPFTAVRWESGLGRAATQTRGRGIPLYRPAAATGAQ